MKKIFFALFLLPATTMFGANKPNPAEFTLKVHVISSSQVSNYAKFNTPIQQLEVMIDNEPLQLQSGPNSSGLLPLGDYPAMIDPRISGGKFDTVDVIRGYILLMPDGSTRKYDITRIGPAIPRP